MANQQALARALGWFSIGLGAAQLAVPRRFGRLIGVRRLVPTEQVLRLVGLREMAVGVGILTRRKPTEFLWLRVAGDVKDLALLGIAATDRRNDRARLGVATAAVAGTAFLDLRAARGLSVGQRAYKGRVRDIRLENEPPADAGYVHADGSSNGVPGATGRHEVAETITVRREPAEVYDFWRDFRNLPRFMRHLEAVEVHDDRRSLWRAKAPGGGSVEWEAEIVEEEPGRLIAWRSAEGAEARNAGHVRFDPAPGGRGTEVQVRLTYEPPLGVIGAAVAKLTGQEPGQQVPGDLRRFKQVMETGDVVRSDATLDGGRLRQRPARPSEKE